MNSQQIVAKINSKDQQTLAIGSININKKSIDWLLLIGGRIVPIALSILYVVLLIIFWGSSPDGGFSSLESVAILFESEGNLATGWIHFLALDLLVGRWMIDDINRTNKAKWRLIPCLPLTFFYGPAGLLLHLLLNAIVNRKQSNV
ncbi:DUF4281 domain-containing protein [Psychromonas sp. psych-6C06]|nr:DUF4281 domain-containing protein [Psychromonas sp. psych-6C06]